MKNDELYLGTGFTVNTDIDEVKNEKPKQEKFSKRREFFEWLDVVTVAIISVIIVFGLFFRVATISGDSMLNTLKDNEKIIITNFLYTPKQGDIVVISRNMPNSVQDSSLSGGPIIKRVIATENQVVDIDFEKGIVYVDGIALKEDYVSTPTTVKREVDFPVKVPKGHIFVLGDNRAVSLDSRSTDIGVDGMIDERYVLGHAVFRVLPFQRIGRLDNK